jgi:pimeloyl-ACP methyl ester carboxylesterase/tetratricopeptide (TPR) repeat protein
MRSQIQVIKHVTAIVAVWSLFEAGVAGQAQNLPIAPELQGLGSHHMPVSTHDSRAQAFFDQGLRLLYAFNHAEARRAFQEAARLDPGLAMAYWGQAMTLAVNLNAPMSPDNGRLAYAAVQHARRLSVSADQKERLLIEALATRFADDGTAPRAPLDRAYADAMASVALKFPDEADIQTLAADARMNTVPWNYWTQDGSLKPEAEPIRRALERVIAAHPDHAGANHYYIHLMEGSRTPEAAEKSADRLGALMPAAGHMVHMPAHIYLRVGRYADAAEANVRAIAADEDYLAQCQAQGLYPISYYPHNLHFLWAAATFQGRSAVAIDAARNVAAKVPHHHAGALSWTADFPVTPWLAYVRFGRWQEMLTEPAPPSHEPYATGIWHYGRALAFVARGDLTRAEAERAALAAVIGHDAFRTTLKDLPLATNLQIASRVVGGELASHAGRHDEAVRLLQEATAIEDGLPYSEPPIWHQPPRQVLGALLLAAGRPSDAEAAYRQDLERFRENGWSLFGLWQSLVAQQRAEEATRVRARFDAAWARADVQLTSSRIMPKQKFATVSTGVRLEYVEQGAADGIPVIFLHGVTDSWRSFELVLRQLPPTIRAYALSQRGHGESSRPAEGYRYTDMSEDVRAFMDAVGLRKAVIVGHSMSSLVAQRFALDHQDRVSGLVLMGAFATMYNDANIAAFYASSIVPLTDPIDLGFAREWQLSTLARPIPPDYFDTVVSETLKVPSRVWRAAFEGFLKTPDFSGELSKVTVPTLVARGDRDTYASAAAQDALVRTIPGARRLTYAGAGHGFHWEDPAQFATDLMTFLRQ